jgi:hypothetical protein
MCRYFDVMGIFFLHSEIWGKIWDLNMALVRLAENKQLKVLLTDLYERKILLTD